MDVQALRLLGLKRLKSLKRLNILLACPTPQAIGTPRPHQWLLMGVQACGWPAWKRLKRLKIKVILKSVLECPTAQAKATPRPHQWLLMGVQACRLPGVKRLKRLKLASKRHPKARSTAAPRPHQLLLCHLSPSQRRPSQKTGFHRPFDGLFALSLSSRFWPHSLCKRGKR